MWLMKYCSAISFSFQRRRPPLRRWSISKRWYPRSSLPPRTQIFVWRHVQLLHLRRMSLPPLETSKDRRDSILEYLPTDPFQIWSGWWIFCLLTRPTIVSLIRASIQSPSQKRSQSRFWTTPKAYSLVFLKKYCRRRWRDKLGRKCLSLKL
jgi:hypothetical protein